MKLLLTGAAGSIGCHTLIHILHNTDWEIVCTDSFSHRGYIDRITEVLNDHPQYVPRVRVITQDLTVPFSELTKKKIGHIDYIINMASLSDVEASIHDPVNFVTNNVKLVLNVLELARELKPLKFIQISTDEVYGPTLGKNDGYKEWAVKLPSNPYAASKSMQEEACIGWWRTYGVPLIITNTMNNFGEMQSSTKYPVMIQKAIARGEKLTVHGDKGGIGSRSYIHSRNFSDALLFILNNVTPHLHVPGEIDRPDRLHIAGDKQVDNLELVKLIGSLMGKEPEYEIVDFHSTRAGHDKHYGLNDDKIKALGWKPPLSFEESLKNTIVWQTNHPEWVN